VLKEGVVERIASPAIQRAYAARPKLHTRPVRVVVVPCAQIFASN